MGTDKRQVAYDQLVALAEKQGYVTFDNIMDCADEHSLPIQDFDWLSNSITTRGILVYSEAPKHILAVENDEEDEEENTESDTTYDRILELCPSLESFISFVKNAPRPRRGELKELKYQVYDGNAYARERFIIMYLRSALKTALQKAEAYDIDIEEAISIAYSGLITAVDKMDPDITNGFTAYAKIWMSNALSREVTTRRPLIHYASQVKTQYASVYHILKTNGCIGCDGLNSCDKAIEKICCHLYCPESDAQRIVEMMIPDVSIEDLVESYVNSTEEYIPDDITPDIILGDLSSETILSDEDAYSSVERQTLRALMNDVLQTLTPREEMVIRLRYGFDGRVRTLEEVGAEFNLTRERIRQIEIKALRKLQHPYRANRLRDFY